MNNNVLYGIFLDDERNPEDVYWIKYPDYQIKWNVVRNVKDFKGIINSLVYEFDACELPDIISLDHDLSERLDGAKAARFLANTCAILHKPLPQCFIHSQNPEGAANIKSILDSYNKVFKS